MLGIGGMNFSVHMDEKTLAELNQVAKEEGISRSALLSEAFRRYSEERSQRVQTNGWPQVLIDHWNQTKPEDYSDHPDFGGASDFKPLRDQLL
jgi:metal-responsive CopG/Arc/MetJ family transcriptional regulator